MMSHGMPTPWDNMFVMHPPERYQAMLEASKTKLSSVDDLDHVP
uniref:Uncharacterized protein n=1 Tax=Picea glauca TaxID=3330 RepID=A0A117NJ27_PICGL|nr:hypothetical protein ABT39_MTgene744 [Picea glauca]